MLWSQDSPMDESHDVWVRNGSSVEDAEKGAILGRGVLTWGRQEALDTSSACRDLAAMMRIMKMHKSPELYAGLA
jgi:hypothetical protein